MGMSRAQRGRVMRTAACSFCALALALALAQAPLAQDRPGVFFALSYKLQMNPEEGERFIAEFMADAGDELRSCLAALDALDRAAPQPWIERCDRNPSPKSRAQCKQENLDSWSDWIATLGAVVRGEKQWRDTSVAQDLAISRWAIVNNFGLAAWESWVRQRFRAAKPLYACE